MDNIQLVIGGAAGEGSKKAGLLIAKILNERGYKIFIHEDYQSVIKGGHNFSYISATKEEHNATREKIDFALALNREGVVKHIGKLKEGGVLIYNSDVVKDIDDVDKDGVNVIGVSLRDIVDEVDGIALMQNTALVAFFAKVVGIPFESVERVAMREFKKETEKNIAVARVAYERGETLKELQKIEREPHALLSGNEAVALGMIDAGLECYFAYPMTPSTGVLTFLAGVEGVRVAQLESEIAVINAGIGSAYAGKRTAIGTSGGGFALMTEGVSLAAQSETPLLIVLSQRMGPATGVPTYQGQGDLLFTLSSGHGDMMRFVVAPGDVDEIYYWGGVAMNMTWKYQMPGVVLLDKELSENRYEFNIEEKITKENHLFASSKENYKRYDGDDISPMLFPGEEGVVIKGTGYEHTRNGISTEEAEEIVIMQDKRKRKYEKLREEVESIEAVKASKSGKVGVVFWGSTKGAIVEATKDMGVKLIQPIVIQPFPKEQLKKALDGVERLICVETNASGQMAQVLRKEGFVVDEMILKYDGRAFTVEELQAEIKKHL